MSNVTAMPTKRRLAAVLSMDVAGYARLMEADEADTLGRLTRYRASIEDNLAEHGGRLVGTAGDSLLAEFQSAVGAVEAALAVQAHMAEENAEAPAERRMLFRMGITVGDVMAEIGDPGAGDIHGETVNLAARLQTHAEPGAVLISSAVFNEVRNKLDVAFVDLGALSVKNITHPVHIYGVGLSGTLRPADELARLEPGVSPAAPIAVSAELRSWRWAALVFATLLVVGSVAALVWLLLPRPASPPAQVASVEKMALPLPEGPSVAVMPVENLTGDPEQEFVADGISESIIATLSKVPKLFVIARNSTFAYKGRHVKVQQVSEELGVRYVLEGTLQQSGEKLRITAQLIDALSGHHLWAEQYDRDMADLFGLLDEISHQIALALQVELTGGEQVRTWASGTDDLDAWRHLNQGISLFWHLNKDDNARAREQFTRATTIDPDYAVAWTWLAGTHWLDATRRCSPSVDESFKLTLQLTQKALAMDESIPIVHALRGDIYGSRGQFGKAIAEGEKAIALGPNNALVLLRHKRPF